MMDSRSHLFADEKACTGEELLRRSTCVEIIRKLSRQEFESDCLG